MKKINKRIRSITLIAGSLLAIAIVACTQLFQFHVNSYSKKEVKTEQQETGQPSGDVVISLPSFSLPAPVHVQLSLDAHCLFVILFEEHQNINASVEAPVYPEKLFITLFRVIISPNAP